MTISRRSGDPLSYQGYEILPLPGMERNGRWSVAVRISRSTSEGVKTDNFIARDGISYILEEEAEKECINLAKNLIMTNQAGF